MCAGPTAFGARSAVRVGRRLTPGDPTAAPAAPRPRPLLARLANARPAAAPPSRPPSSNRPEHRAPPPAPLTCPRGAGGGARISPNSRAPASPAAPSASEAGARTPSRLQLAQLARGSAHSPARPRAAAAAEEQDDGLVRVRGHDGVSGGGRGELRVLCVPRWHGRLRPSPTIPWRRPAWVRRWR